MRLLREISGPGRWILLTLALVSCRGAPSAAAPPRYTVRGEVVRVPARPEGELVVRHEAIPTFADRTGAVVGMDAMVMPFPIAPGVALAGLAPGDKIAFTFSVDWAQGRYAIERVERLPPATALTLGKPHAAGDAASR